MKTLPLAAAFLALALLPAQAQDPVRHGRALAKEFCARCHAIGKRGASPHEGAPPFRTLGRSYDLDQFVRVLLRGISASHPDMPQIKFKPQEARALRDYLRTVQE